MKYEMISAMENDISTAVNAVLLGDPIFPIDEYNHSTLFLAPIRDPLYIVIPMTIIYVVIFVTGLVGNIVTFVVIVKNKYMHTATNYYLFSLAISDLLLLVSGLPQEMVSIWCRYPYLFGEVFCVLRGLSAETSTNASVLTITAFTVERYVAICHPFLAQTMSKLSRAVKLIVVIWLVALSFAIPQAIQFGVVTIDNDPNQAMCTLKRTVIDHSFVLSSFLFFVTPMILITVLYALIGMKLRKSNMMKRNGGSFYSNCDSRSSQHRRNHPPHHQSSRRVLKMLAQIPDGSRALVQPPRKAKATPQRKQLGAVWAVLLLHHGITWLPTGIIGALILVAVVVAFFICWAPFHAQRLVYTYGSNKDYKPKGAVLKYIYEIITYISGILYYVSTTINPILYHIMSLKFREAFKDTLARCTGLPSVKGRRGRRSYSILNRYHQRGTKSGGEAHSYDSDNLNNYLRENSLPSNCLNSILGDGFYYSSRYKCRRKTMSFSEATDDSVRTEVTQFSQRADPLSRKNSQQQLTVIVRIEKSELQAVNRPTLWKNRTSLNKINKFWKMFNCIRPGSSESSINSENCFRSLNFFKAKPNFNQTETVDSIGGLTAPEGLAMNLLRKEIIENPKRVLSNNVSNCILKEHNKKSLCGELVLNAGEVFESEDEEEKEKEARVYVPFSPGGLDAENARNN